MTTLRYLADSAYDAQQLELAARVYRALARDDNPPEYVAQGLSGLAWLDWSREGGAADAAEKFGNLLTQFPDSPLAPEAAMVRGQALEQLGETEQSLEMYRRVMEQYSESEHVGAAMLAAAQLYDKLQRQDEAEPLLRDWLERHPTSPQRPAALYQLAWTLVDLHRDDDADKVFRQIHENCWASPYWSDATYRLAERAARERDCELAMTLTSEIIDLAKEPQMVGYALYLQGQMAAAAKRWSEAIDPLQKLIHEYPDSQYRLVAEYWLAESRYRLRQFDEAGALFEKLDKQTGDRTEAWVAMIPLRRAQVLAHHRQWEKAFEIVSQFETRFPNFAHQYEIDYMIGRYHASRAEFEEAREAYQCVIDSPSGRATETAAVAQWMIGETFFMQKQYNQAIRAYFRVEGLYEYPRWKAAALLQAGKCHEMVGRWAEATQLYSRVVQDYPHTVFVAKAAQRLQVAQQQADSVISR